MIAVEFSLKISSMYSIRVPYSYQCARTYPLPAPSTIKGLCANALWRRYGGDPVEHLKEIHRRTIGATARADCPIAVSACTVRIIPMNALIRQFAFTPSITCMIVFEEDSGELPDKVAEALKTAPLYLGDSESLVTCSPPHSSSDVQKVNVGEAVETNTLCPFNLIDQKSIENKPDSRGVVLYMQEDPISDNAILERYLAPLSQKGDTYYPLDKFSFEVSNNCFLVRGQKLTSVFRETSPAESSDKPKRGRKVKSV